MGEETWFLLWPEQMKTAFAKSRVHAAGRLARAERCFSCNEPFKDSDEVAVISTETGFVCEIPGDCARYVVWQPGDAEVFHKACWERLGISKAPTC